LGRERRRTVNSRRLGAVAVIIVAVSLVAAVYFLTRNRDENQATLQADAPSPQTTLQPTTGRGNHAKRTAPAFYQGSVDTEWITAFSGALDAKIEEADAIIVGQQGISGGSEFVASSYRLSDVLKGEVFLSKHLVHREGSSYVNVEYFNPSIGKQKLEPEGPTILFVRAPERGSKTLSIINDKVEDGMIYATQQMVSKVRTILAEKK
jgi:hypothetical protein